VRPRPLALVAIIGAVAIAAAMRLPAHTSPREDLPPEYAGKSNPLVGPEAVAAGASLFQQNCATCHGALADGRGPASTGLVPPPADFRRGAVLAQHSDAYLYYRMTTGKPGTAMPSFHGVLDETARWQVISYLRTLATRDPRPDGAARADAGGALPLRAN
jgi:high-affinity iron transporter